MMTKRRNIDALPSPTAFQFVWTKQVFCLLLMNPNVFQLRDKER